MKYGRNACSDAVRLLLKVARKRRVVAQANLRLYLKARNCGNVEILKIKECL